MSDNNKLLSLALIVFGAAFCLIYPLAIVWPSGWAWHEGSPAVNDYFLMIVGLYATLGIFMILDAEDRAEEEEATEPLLRLELEFQASNRSLIWFVVWSSVVHAAIMAWEAMRSPMMGGHLTGDVPVLLLVAIVLGLLASRGPSGRRTMAA